MKDGSGIGFASHVNAAEKGSTSDATNFLQEKKSLVSAEEEHHQLWLNPPGVLLLVSFGYYCLQVFPVTTIVRFVDSSHLFFGGLYFCMCVGVYFLLPSDFL